MKRLVTLAAAIVGAVTIALVPASAASAHSNSHALTINVSMTIKDADWPDADDYAYPSWTRNITLSGTAQSVSTQFQGCADEVRIVLDVTISHNPSPFAGQEVSVNTRTRLYEGTSCSTTDLDASASRSFGVGPYSTISDQWVVSSDGNHVSTILTIRNSPF
jgi:hypothetical protein